MYVVKIASFSNIRINYANDSPPFKTFHTHNSWSSYQSHSNHCCWKASFNKERINWANDGIHLQMGYAWLLATRISRPSAADTASASCGRRSPRSDQHCDGLHRRELRVRIKRAAGRRVAPPQGRPAQDAARVQRLGAQGPHAAQAAVPRWRLYPQQPRHLLLPRR